MTSKVPSIAALLTVAVMALTGTASADPAPPPPPADTAAQAAAPAAPVANVAANANTQAPVAAAPIPAATGTPLHLRSSGLSSSESSGGGSLWKLGAFAAIIAAAAWYMRKKRGALAKAAGPTRAIQVISRASVGVRTELVMVEVDGMTLLLGVTPASVSRLAILGAGEIATAKEEATAPEEDAEPIAAIPERFGALLEGIKKSAAPRMVADEPTPVEPQARGLLALRKR